MLQCFAFRGRKEAGEVAEDGVEVGKGCAAGAVEVDVVVHAVE